MNLLDDIQLNQFVQLCFELLNFELKKHKRYDLFCLRSSYPPSKPNLIEKKIIVRFFGELENINNSYELNVDISEDSTFESLFIELLSHKKFDLKFLDSKRLPEGLVLNAVRWGDGRWVTLNNRTLYIAQQAGLIQIHPKDAGDKGMNKLKKLLHPLGPFESVVLRCK